MRAVRQLDFAQDPNVSHAYASQRRILSSRFQYDALRQLFHNALEENKFVNDGDFDWVKRLQEHRLNRQKAANPTIAGLPSSTVPVTPSTGATPKALASTMTATSLSAATTSNTNHESRYRSIVQRTTYQPQLPMSSTNATTTTLNGDSKTTLSTASGAKIPSIVPFTRTAVETQRSGPPPTKRRGLLPTPTPSLTYFHTHQQTQSGNQNNSNNTPLNKDQYSSSVIGPSSGPTCCFFKRKTKRALQMTSSR